MIKVLEFKRGRNWKIALKQVINIWKAHKVGVRYIFFCTDTTVGMSSTHWACYHGTCWWLSGCERTVAGTRALNPSAAQEKPDMGGYYRWQCGFLLSAAQTQPRSALHAAEDEAYHLKHKVKEPQNQVGMTDLLTQMNIKMRTFQITDCHFVTIT